MKEFNSKDMTEKDEFFTYGKETTYEVPDGFFDSIAEKTLLLAKDKERIHLKNRKLWQSFAAAASLAALFFIGYQTEFRHDTNVSQLIAQDSQLQANSQHAIKLETSSQKEVIEHPKQVTEKISIAISSGSEAISDVLAEFTDEELQQMAALDKSDPIIGEIEQ